MLLLIYFDFEADGHPQRRGATAEAGKAAVADKASISGIARTHGKQPPGGPASVLPGQFYPVPGILEDLKLLYLSSFPSTI